MRTVWFLIFPITKTARKGYQDVCLVNGVNEISKISPNFEFLIRRKILRCAEVVNTKPNKDKVDFWRIPKMGCVRTLKLNILVNNDNKKNTDNDNDI